MRLPAYLCTSRHGIYYFRFPIPVDCHPNQKRAHIKFSLGTREPRDAGRLARILVVAGQTLLARPMLRAMRYDEIRHHVHEHFGQLLRDFSKNSAAIGPVSGQGLDALRATHGLAESDLQSWAAMSHADGAEGLLQAFCDARGIAQSPEAHERDLMLAELQKGYRDYASRALAHTAEFDTLPLEQQPSAARPTYPTSARTAQAEADALPFADVSSRYFDELARTNALVPKTEGDKRDALALLSELTKGKAPAHMTKTDAQEVKAALFKLPKHRNKNPRTRDLPLSDMLEVSAVERIAARTMNVYLGHMQSLFSWAVNNNYATDNIFAGLRVKAKRTGQDDGRKAFTADQLQLMFTHLTDPHNSLVKKDVHKWPALIAMFTGMRLNEVAQLDTDDIELIGEVWCINVTAEGDVLKHLKNSASKRRVPVHDSLKACGFLEFHEAQKKAGHKRLFPELTHSKQNGYGRNAGRWFNDRFLTALGLDGQGYVFHCLRHTMITRLAQAGVEEALIKALVGHSQDGVTYSVYFKAGYLPTQLQEAINVFDF